MMTNAATFIDSVTLVNLLRASLLSKESVGGSHGLLEVCLCFTLVPLVIQSNAYKNKCRLTQLFP